MDQRVWASEDGSAWFLLPVDVSLPEGDHSIRDLLGRTRRIDRAAADGYAVGKAIAEEATRKEILSWLGKLEAGVGSVSRHLEERNPGGGAPLGALQQIVGLMAQRLTKPGEKPPKPTVPDDLMERIEGFVHSIGTDPARIEQLKRAAEDLGAAAEKLKAITPGSTRKR